MNSLIRTSSVLLLLGVFPLGCGGKLPVDLVVLITLDPVRADHLGAYGYPRETSPFIDSLAERGVVFEHAVSSCSYTAPAHASIFTSLHPFQHRVLENGHPVSDSLVTLAEMLQQRGYETAAFVSARFLKELRQGFDLFDYPVGLTRINAYRSARKTVNHALKWLEQPQRSKKSFVWLHLFDVHEAHEPRTRIAARDLEAVTKSAPGASLQRFLRTRHGVADEFLDAETLDVVDRYDAQIHFVDSALRRLFNRAGRDPRNADSVWIVTADHGEGLWTHGARGHGGHIYQEQVRVPLIFHFTKRPVDARRIQALVRHVDILPTVVELVDESQAGEESQLQGRSLMALIAGAIDSLPAAYAFSQRRSAKPWEADREIYSLQDRGFKYIARSRGPDEFYDLIEDPFESNNLVDAPSPELERFRQALRSQYREPNEAAVDGEEVPPIAPEYREELEALGYLEESP